MRRLLFSAVVAFVLFAGIVGCKVSPPGKHETMMLHWVKHHVTVRGDKNINPIRDDAGAVEEGKQAFRFYCVVCHGRDGQNTGVPFAAKMSPPIPSLASAEIQSYSDGQLKWIIENGISPSGMPASRGVLTDDDMWAIVLYLRHLPPAGSLGDPRVYSGEDSDASTDKDSSQHK